MRTVLGALTLILATTPAMAQTTTNPVAPGCVIAGLPSPTQRVVGGNNIVFVRPLATVLDTAVDDFGANGLNDAISVYCVTKTRTAPRGSIAMCLTGESCPWR